MSNEELDKKWNEIIQEVFDKFIQENVGYEGDSGQPVCFGTGNDRPYCVFCDYRKSC